MVKLTEKGNWSDSMKLIVRGRIFSFKRAPVSIHDSDSYIYLEDGLLFIENDKIISMMPYSDLKENLQEMIAEHA